MAIWPSHVRTVAKPNHRRRHTVVLLAALAVSCAVSATVAGEARAASDAGASGVSASGVSPVANWTAAQVTADALPTAQINGVVWSQAVVGNTVYAGGSFSQARPAGAPAGTNETPRDNLLAYDLTTGKLSSSFAPVLNGQVKAIAASPDGSTIYVGGAFTTVDGIPHARLAAFNAVTGKLINTFTAGTDAEITSIVATNRTIYFGGGFSQVDGTARARLAAVTAGTGTLTGWAPDVANYDVEAMVLSPDRSRLVVGGSFTSINNTDALGLASLDPVTGEVQPYAVSSIVQNYGPGSAITSLTTDGHAIYGTGYSYLPFHSGALEGTFSVDPDSGRINWVEDCHGDSYGNYPTGDTVYVAGHAHDCSTIGGFPNTSPETYHRTVAFTTQATGTVQPNQDTGGYTDFSGQPSPSLINWFPDLTAGSYTGLDQAAWSISGNSTYVVEGGEFTAVNGVPQQGLVRFAVTPPAPNLQSPMVSGYYFRPSTSGVNNTSVTLSWPANWSRDNQNFTYRVARNGDTGHPVYTTTGTSQFWNRPTMTWSDTGLLPGTTYSYRLQACAANGPCVWGDTITVSTTGSAASNRRGSGTGTNGAHG